MANRLSNPKIQVLDGNGDPYAGAKMYFYQSGTTTALDTFSDTALTVANANPVVADADGRFGDIFLQAQDYNVVLKDSNDVTIWSADPVAGTVETTGDYFKPTESSPQAMTIELGSGTIFDMIAKTLTVVAAQTSAVMVAPTGNPRNDIIYVDRITGVDGTVTGVEAASPVDPTIPDDKLPVARVNLTVGMTEITTTDIDDIREINLLGAPGFKDEDDLSSDSATHAPSQQSVKAYVDAAVPRGYIDGLIMSNDTDTDHDILFGVGVCTNADDDEMLQNSTPMTKQIDATWAAGDDAGGLSSSLTAPSADTWYHCFIGKVSGTVDFGFDTSITGANLAADHSFTDLRRIGAVLTDASSNIIAFRQNGDVFYWDVPVNDYSGSGTTTRTLRTISVSTGLKIRPIHNHQMSFSPDGTARYSIVTDPDQTDTAPDLGSHTLANNGGSSQGNNAFPDVLTNTSAQIGTRQSTNTSIAGVTFGWIDPRGRNS